MGDFTEGNVVFKLGDVVSKWEILCDGSGSEPCNSFVLDVNVNERCFEVGWKVAQVPSDGGVSARAFLVKVDAQIAADPSFMKDRAKATFLLSVS